MSSTLDTPLTPMTAPGGTKPLLTLTDAAVAKVKYFAETMPDSQGKALRQLRGGLPRRRLRGREPERLGRLRLREELQRVRNCHFVAGGFAAAVESHTFVRY